MESSNSINNQFFFEEGGIVWSKFSITPMSHAHSHNIVTHFPYTKKHGKMLKLYLSISIFYLRFYSMI